MEIKRELSFNKGFISEQLGWLFDLINKFQIINATENLLKCNFSNLSNKDVQQPLRTWIKDVDEYFEEKSKEPLRKDGITHAVNLYQKGSFDINSASEFKELINDFLNKLNDLIIKLNVYLKIVNESLPEYQNNESVLKRLFLIKNALESRKNEIVDIQCFICENLE